MDRFFLLLLIPTLSALAAAIAPRWVVQKSTAFGIGIVVLFWTAAALLAAVSLDSEVLWSTPWVAQLGIDFAFRLTAFSAWFGILILFLGGCIHLYACSYFSKNERLPSLLILLGLFTTSMLGVIWADNFYLLFLFWEGTSLLSFLLVGFHNDKLESRTKASQALLVTMTGGGALLGGLVLLHHHLGTANISGVLAASPETLPTAAVILIMIGAMTKSAQWPFHFWLPNAMVGPTPVSAFLHSATMVKAGVFILATLAPALKIHPIWTPTLVTCGILTIAVAGLRGFRNPDLKAILASTTLAALGLLTFLAGLGTPAALMAFAIFLTAHALYKAPLFLSAGNLEKRFGTRDVPRLVGGGRALPLTGFVIVVSVLSHVGIPPLPGFLGKEYYLKASLAYPPLFTALSLIVLTVVLALGWKILFPLFSRKSVPESAGKPVPAGMSYATFFPALAALAVMITLAIPGFNFLGPVATSLGAYADAHYEYWHGWNTALFLSLGAIVLSLMIAPAMIRATASGKDFRYLVTFDQLYDSLINGLKFVASICGKLQENGPLRLHLAVILVSVGGLSFYSLDPKDWERFSVTWSHDSYIFLWLTPLLTFVAVAAARQKETIPLLVSLGFVGFIIALIYLWYSAPDLALTQVTTETLILFLVAGALHKGKMDEINLPKTPERPFIRLLIACGGGVLVTLLILESMVVGWDVPISQYHLENSKKLAFGANVVNVILVDFRALDTLGEITVLAIAALGANAALGAARKRAPLPSVSPSSMLNNGARILTYFLIPTVFWVFWRGHNNPGGGFIAALVAAGWIGMGLLASRTHLTPSWMRKTAHRLLLWGLSIAFFSSILPLFSGSAFFAGLWLHFGDFHLGSPVLFDLGVFLTVVGFCLTYLRHFHIRTL